MDRRIKYLSLKTVARQAVKQKCLMIIGGILTSFLAFGIIGGIAGEGELRGGIPVYLVFLIPSLMILYRGYDAGRQIGAARRYESIFAADKDGIVTADELVRQTGKSPSRISKELERLFQAGYFYDCTLQQGGELCVLISEANTDERGIGFVMVKCKSCGGSTRIRAGSRGICQFCGSAIAN